MQPAIFKRMIALILVSAGVVFLPASAVRAQDILQTVWFPSGGARLSTEARASLDQVASWLEANPHARIQIQGHSDRRGSRETNMAMGERRAGTVKTYLIGQGIGADRMDTVSFGEEAPLDASDTPEAWAKNRRCTIVKRAP